MLGDQHLQQFLPLLYSIRWIGPWGGPGILGVTIMGVRGGGQGGHLAPPKNAEQGTFGN